MAQEIDINLNVNTSEADKSLGSLKSQLREAQNEVNALADKFGATSKEAVNAAKRAAELKDRIGDAKALTDAFNPDAKFKALSASLTGVAGGFSVVTGAMGAFGGQSKEVEQSLLKVQSAMAMASGLQAVGESIDSFKQLGAVVKSYSIVQKAITAGQWLWNAAMAANPLGAIVAAIAAVIAAGYLLIKMFMDSAKANEDAIAATKKNTKALEQNAAASKKAKESLKENNDQQYALAKASGASAEELRKLNLKHAEEAVALNYSSSVLASNTFKRERNTLAMLKSAGASDEAIEGQQKLTEASYKELQSQNEALKSSYAERRKVINQNEVEIVQEKTDARTKATEKEKADNEKDREDLKARLKKEAEDLAKWKEEIAKNSRDKQREEAYKSQDEIEAATKANEEALLTSQELLIQKENEAYQIKYDNAVKAGYDTEQLEILHLNNLNQINLTAQEKQYADDKVASDKLIENAKIEAQAKKEIQDATFANIEAGFGLLKGLFEKNKGIQKGAMIIESALGIAKIVVNTQTANAVAMASPINAVDPTYGARMRVINMISAGIGIASNIAATAKGLSALGGGGGAGGGSAAGGAGGGSAPTFNVVGQGGANQIAEGIGARDTQPLRAFVVGGDVTTQQSLNMGIVQNATLG